VFAAAPPQQPVQQQQQHPPHQVSAEQSFAIFADESMVEEEDRDDGTSYRESQGVQAQLQAQAYQQHHPHHQQQLPTIAPATATTFIPAGSTNTSLGSTLPSTLYGHSNSSSATARYSDISRLVGSLEETNMPMNASGYTPAQSGGGNGGFAPTNPDDSGMSVGLAHLSMHQSLRRTAIAASDQNNHALSGQSNPGSVLDRNSSSRYLPPHHDHSYSRDSLLGARLSLIAPLASPSSSSSSASNGIFSHHFQLDRIVEEPEEGVYNNSGENKENSGENKENSGDKMKPVSNSHNLLQIRRSANLMEEEEEEQSRSPQRSFIQYREPRGNVGATTGALNPSKRMHSSVVPAPAPAPVQQNESFGIYMDESLVFEEQESASRAPYESPSKVPYPRVSQVVMQQQQHVLHPQYGINVNSHSIEYDRLPPDARRLSQGIKKHRSSLMTKHRPNQNMLQ
jgi:hypothetical protein